MFPMIGLIRVIGRPELVTFLLALFNYVAGSYDECDIFLGYHPPEVLECDIERTLASNYFAVTNCKRSIHEVCIDVAVFIGFEARLHAGPLYKMDSWVLVRQDVGVSIHSPYFCVIQTHLILNSRICAPGENLIKLWHKVVYASPLWQGLWLFRVSRKFVFNFLPDGVWYIFVFDSRSANSCGICWDLGKFCLQKLTYVLGVLLFDIGHPSWGRVCSENILHLRGHFS